MAFSTFLYCLVQLWRDLDYCKSFHKGNFVKHVFK